MELFGKITDIRESRTGTRQDGTPWRTTPFVVTEVSGEYPQSILLETFDDPEKVGIVKDAVGTARFSCNTFMSRNGSLYNQIRFRGWKPYIVEAKPATTQQAPAEQKAEANVPDVNNIF